MTDQKKRFAVDLTASEVEGIERRAQEQGVSTPDFLAFCVRALSYGLNYALSMLPKQGQAGTHEQE